MRTGLYVILSIFLLVNVSFANDSIEVYEKDGNIYINDASDEEIQLTFENKDHSPVLSPDGQKVVFIRYNRPCPYDSNTGWFPGNYDEIWSINIEKGNPHSIIKNNYSENIDMKNYLGSFDSLHISVDGKKIYFLCQNCTVDAILYMADIDGSNIRRICNVHQLDLVGGNSADEYYGYLVIGQRQLLEGSVVIKWASVLLDKDGNVIKEIEDIDQFWLDHEKL